MAGAAGADVPAGRVPTTAGAVVPGFTAGAVNTGACVPVRAGVPLEVFVNKFAHSRFEPAGFTKNPDIPIAKSITDYIFRYLGIQFVPGYRQANTPQRDYAGLPASNVGLPQRATKGAQARSSCRMISGAG